MSLRACLAWEQDTSGLDVCSCTTLGICPVRLPSHFKAQLVLEALADS